MDQYGLRGYNEIIYPNRSLSSSPSVSLKFRHPLFRFYYSYRIRHGAFCKLIHMTAYGKEIDYELAVLMILIWIYCFVSGINQDVYQRIGGNMSQHPDQLASTAVDMLIDYIKKGMHYHPTQTFIDCDLAFPGSAQKTEKEK